MSRPHLYFLLSLSFLLFSKVYKKCTLPSFLATVHVIVRFSVELARSAAAGVRCENCSDAFKNAIPPAEYKKLKTKTTNKQTGPIEFSVSLL